MLAYKLDIQDPAVHLARKNSEPSTAVQEFLFKKKEKIINTQQNTQQLYTCWKIARVIESLLQRRRGTRLQLKNRKESCFLHERKMFATTAVSRLSDSYNPGQLVLGHYTELCDFIKVDSLKIADWLTLKISALHNVPKVSAKIVVPCSGENLPIFNTCMPLGFSQCCFSFSSVSKRQTANITIKFREHCYDQFKYFPSNSIIWYV